MVLFCKIFKTQSWSQVRDVSGALDVVYSTIQGIYHVYIIQEYLNLGFNFLEIHSTSWWEQFLFILLLLQQHARKLARNARMYNIHTFHHRNILIYWKSQHPVVRCQIHTVTGYTIQSKGKSSIPM